MGVKKRKFEGRSERYNLKAFHNKIIKYKSDRIGRHQSTDFLDISATGLSFVSSPEGVPDVGSIIRITFSIPESKPITIKAQVMRTKKYNRPEWYKRYYDEDDKQIEEYFVAVHFINIKKINQEELEAHLDQLIKYEKQERKEQKISYIKNGFLKSYKWIFISVISLIALGTSLKIYFG